MCEAAERNGAYRRPQNKNEKSRFCTFITAHTSIFGNV